MLEANLISITGHLNIYLLDSNLKNEIFIQKQKQCMENEAALNVLAVTTVPYRTGSCMLTLTRPAEI